MKIVNALNNGTGKDANLKLVIVNTSSSEERRQVNMRMRTSVVDRARSLCGCAMNHVMEHALERLCDDLEALPKGSMQIVINGDVDPEKRDNIDCAYQPGANS